MQNLSEILLHGITNGLRKPNIVFGGVDAGNGYSKGLFYVLVNNRYQVVEVCIPSIVAAGRIETNPFLASNEGIQEKLLQLTSGDGLPFTVAMDMSVDANKMNALPTGGDVYQSSIARGALVHAVITKALTSIDANFGGQEITCYLAGTTMASNYWVDNGLQKNQQRIAEVAAAIGSPFSTSNQYPIINIARTEVFGETLAAMLSVTIDENGNNNGEYADGSEIVFVDVGHTDTVILVAEIKNGLPNIIKRQSIRMGIGSGVLEVVAHRVGHVTEKPVSAELGLLSRPSVKHRGRTIDLLPFQKEAMNGLSQQVLGYISKAIGRGDDFDATYLVGGFPQVAIKLFGPGYFTNYGQIHNLQVPDLPIYANARGALRGLIKRIINKR
jgi:hypothetical protein